MICSKLFTELIKHYLTSPHHQSYSRNSSNITSPHHQSYSRNSSNITSPHLTTKVIHGTHQTLPHLTSPPKLFTELIKHYLTSPHHHKLFFKLSWNIKFHYSPSTIATIAGQINRGVIYCDIFVGCYKKVVTIKEVHPFVIYIIREMYT